MATQKPKRSRPVPTTSQRSKKRQKIATASSYAPAGSGSDVRKVPVALDALPWNEVEMPDMFEDAEGFFGLEEVDDVEVVRNGNQVKFVTKTPIDEDEFRGFDDDVINESLEDPKVKLKGANANSNAAKSANTDKANLPKSGKSKGDNGDSSQSKKEKRKEKEKAAKLTAKSLESTTKSKTKNQSGKESVTPNMFTALEDEAQDEDMSEWAELDLSSAMLSALAKIGFKAPTPIQREAIPHVLSGSDVIGKASTGSGKTLAFGIPIIERWLEENRSTGNEATESDAKTQRNATALILSPTRELAHQLTDHLTKLCKGLSDAPYIATVTGGLSIQKQQRQLLRADIIIGTPGRLWEVLSTGIDLSKSLETLKFLVIDEADRLLSEGHFKEAEEILSKLDRHDVDEEHVVTRQTLVFSATLAKGLQQKLSGKGRLGDDGMEYLMKKLKFKGEPKFIDVATSAMAEGLKEGVIECGATEKDLYLYTLLMHHPNLKTIIFTNSIHTVQRLIPLLTNLSLSPVALHSNMPQKARLRSIERFSSLLVATDVAARGLDLPSVQLVIHYHLPRAADMYVHRSGRTARAGAQGTSIMLCAPDEAQSLRRLAGKVGAIRTLDLDRRVASLLRPRVALAKRIADAGLAKSKGERGDEWARKAAEELGVDYDSEEFERKGKAGGRARKEKEARGVTKDEMGRMKAELGELLAQRVNVGVSERYLTGVDVNALLKGGGKWLGSVEGLE